MRIFSTGLLAFVAFPVAASVPPILCHWDHQEKRIDWLPSNLPNRFETIVPETVGEGFISFHVGWGGLSSGTGDVYPSLSVILNCNSGQNLMVQNSDAVAYERFEELVDGNAKYTMAQIGEELIENGSVSEVSNRDIGDCTCTMTN